MEKGKTWVVAFISACVIAVVVVAGAYMVGIFEFEDPDKPTLRLGIIPAEDQLEMLRKFEPVARYLERELGMNVETFSATDYTGVIEAMRAKKIDVAFFGPFSYVLAAERANAVAIVAGGIGGELATYYSRIVTHKDSGLKNIGDLKEHANRVTFAFVDRASASGHLIPRGLLLAMGIDPSTDFRQYMFAGGHDAVGLAVRAQRVDAGAMHNMAYDRLIAGGAITPEEVIIIWQSDPIPRSPIAVRGDLDPALKKRIRQAFLDLPKRDPEAMRTFEAKWERNVEYVAVDTSAYDIIREIARELGFME